MARSRPSWACGLKFEVHRFFNDNIRVTPLVGVWIEIRQGRSWCAIGGVTPLVGVWIEIRNSKIDVDPGLVTPLVGVWIEIFLMLNEYSNRYGHAPRGRVD